MTRLTIITDKMEGMSIDHIANALAAAAMELGADVKIVRAGKVHGEEVAGAHVISLLPTELFRYVAGFRFARPASFTTVIASNWEERELPDQLKLLAYHMAPTWSGVPVQLVAHSKHTTDLVQKLLRSMMSPSFARAVSAQLETVMYGIESGFEPGTNDPDSLVVPYNRINQTQKRCGLQATITHEYNLMSLSRGRNVTSTFYRGAADYAMSDVPAEMVGVHEFQQEPASREVFKVNARTHGMFVCTSLFESFGIYYLELLASGVVGVFADAPWHKSLLPGYRYTAKSQHLSAMMMHVRENYDEARRYLLDEVRPAIIEKYSISRFNAELLAHAQGGVSWVA